MRTQDFNLFLRGEIILPDQPHNVKVLKRKGTAKIVTMAIKFTTWVFGTSKDKAKEGK